VSELLQRAGRLDLLVNNAGQTHTSQSVAEAIVRVAASKSPKLRYRVGSDAVWVPRLKAIVPGAMLSAQMRKRFGL
jgi:NAD(P)-dependent dehydrogenase (short-subunit alcohol dehydrogenase family)